MVEVSKVFLCGSKRWVYTVTSNQEMPCPLVRDCCIGVIKEKLCVPFVEVLSVEVENPKIIWDELVEWGVTDLQGNR
jgi:hypothetical protein